MPSLSCCICNKIVTRTNNAASCAKCLLNYHFKCINLSSKLVNDILNGSITQWFCLNCDTLKNKSNLNTSNRHSINVKSSVNDNIISDQVNKPKSKAKTKVKSSNRHLDTTSSAATVNITGDQAKKLKSKPNPTSTNSHTFTATSPVSNNIVGEQAEKLAEVVRALQLEIKTIQESHGGFLRSISSINDKLSALQDISQVLGNHSARIKSLEDDKTILVANVKDLSNRVDSYDQNLLTNQLEIACVPVSESESIPDLVIKISEKLNQTLTKEDFNTCHRKRAVPAVNSSSLGRIPTIIVSFKDIQKRNNLLTAFRARRGIKLSEIGFNNESYFFINESLTNTRKKLFYTAKTFQKANNFKYLWTRNGRIFLKKTDNSGVINIDLNTDFTTLNGSN